MRRLARGTPEGRPTRRRPLALTTMVTPLLLLALAACGEPAAGPGVASADNAGATPSATSSAAKADPNKFAACMRDHGVQVEIEDGGGIGISGKAGDEGKLEAAHKACQQFMPRPDAADMKPMSKADQAKFLAYAKCMRDHGIDMPDPKFEGGGVTMQMGSPEGPGPDQGKLEAAEKACQKIMPEQFRPGANGGPAGGSRTGSQGGGA